MREALCLALARHKDAVSVDVARAIVLEVMGAQTPIDLTRYEPVNHSGYVVQAERFADCLGELDPLHRAHWLETESHRHGLQLDPNYRAIADMERTGRVLQVTARHGGQLVGHCRMYVFRSLHTSLPMAEEDTVFIDAAHRGTWLVMTLLRYVESCLRPLGVREVTFTTKHANRADVILRRLGYLPNATRHTKILEGESHVR